MAEIQCPNCGFVIEPPTNAERALDCYWAVQRGALSASAYGRREGIYPSHVLKLRRLGICLVEIGITPDTALWKLLANQNRGEYVYNPYVGRVIETPGSTVADVQEAVDRQR